MAIYMEDLLDINLNGGSLSRSFLNRTIGSGDTDANRFGVRVYRDGVPVDLSGCSCQAIFMNAAGVNIALTSYGTVSGNEAYVTLPQACYNVEGQFCLAIKLVKDGVTVTSRIVDGVVCNTGTTGTVAPTESVPTYQEILDVYDEMTAATAAANAAIAEEFDATEDYPEGKYVINEGNLYVLPAGHEADVTWANTTKADCNFGDELLTQKAGLKAVEENPVFNIFDNPNIVWHKPTGTTSGVAVRYVDHGEYSFSGTSSAVVAEDYFANLSSLPLGVKAGDNLDIFLKGIYNVTFRVFYSSDGSAWTNIMDMTADGEYKVTVPSNAIGLLFRVYIASGVQVNTTVRAEVFVEEYPAYAEKAIRYAESGFMYGAYRIGEMTPSDVLDGFYPVVRAELQSASNYKTREYKPLPGSRIRVKTVFSGGAYDKLIQYVKFFNADRSYYTGLNSVSGTNTIDTVVTMPYWAETMAVCANNPGDPLDYYVGLDLGIAVFIGDSYVQGNSLATAGLDQRNRFSSQLCRRFGWLEKNYAVGGMGFITGNTPYQTQIENAIADTSYDHAKVGMIFICGGRNDVADPVDTSSLLSAVQTAIATAHEAFPNAMIVLAPMMWSNGVIHQNIYCAYKTICKGAEGAKVAVIQRAYTWLTGMKGMILSDKVHPNVEGHTRIADRITNALTVGNPNVYPTSQRLEPVYAGLDESDFCAMTLEDGIITMNAHITVAANVAAGTSMFSLTVSDLNDQFYISNNPTYVPCVNIETGETALLAYTSVYYTSSFMNIIKTASALPAGTWYVLSHKVTFGMEEYAGNA